MSIKKYSFIIYLKLKLYTLFFICILLLIISLNNSCFISNNYYKISCCQSTKFIFLKSNKFYISKKHIKSINYLQHIYFKHNNFLYLNNIHLNIAKILLLEKKYFISINFYKSFIFLYPNNYFNEYIYYQIIKTSLKYINKNSLSDKYYIYLNKSLIYYYIYKFPFTPFYKKIYLINKYLNKEIIYYQINLSLYLLHNNKKKISKIRLKNILLNYYSNLNYIIEQTLIKYMIIKKYNL